MSKRLKASLISSISSSVRPGRSTLGFAPLDACDEQQQHVHFVNFSRNCRTQPNASMSRHGPPFPHKPLLMNQKISTREFKQFFNLLRSRSAASAFLVSSRTFGGLSLVHSNRASLFGPGSCNVHEYHPSSWNPGDAASLIWWCRNMAATLQLNAMLGLRLAAPGSLIYLDETDVQFISGRNLIRYDCETRAVKIQHGSLEASGITAVAVTPNRRFVSCGCV